MRVAVFYHVYGSGLWEEPLQEFRAALMGYPAEAIYLGVVATSLGLAEEVQRAFPEALILDAKPVGHESLTINLVQSYAQEHDGAVLYAHTKGAAFRTEHNLMWRRAMTQAIVQADPDLLRYYDAMGPFWMTDWPESGNRFFGGNFWLARTSYLRKLPPCGDEHRWVPESWVGSGDPTVKDLLPGVPGLEYFGLEPVVAR